MKFLWWRKLKFLLGLNGNFTWYRKVILLGTKSCPKNADKWWKISRGAFASNNAPWIMSCKSLAKPLPEHNSGSMNFVGNVESCEWMKFVGYCTTCSFKHSLVDHGKRFAIIDPSILLNVCHWPPIDAMSLHRNAVESSLQLAKFVTLMTVNIHVVVW